MIRSLLRQTLWQTIGAGAGQGATMVTNALLARLLGAAGFGVYGFLLGTLNTWALMAQCSTGLLAARYVASYRADEPSRVAKLLSCAAGVTTATGLLAALLLVVVRTEIGEVSVEPGAVNTGIVYVAICLPIATLTLLQAGALAGFQAFRSSAIAALLAAPLFVVLPIVGGVFGGASGAVAGVAVAFVARFAFNQFALHREWPAVLTKPSAADWKWFGTIFASFATPAALTGITMAGSAWLGNLWLLSQEDGTQQLGWVTLGQLLRALITFIPAQIAVVSMAALTRSGRSGSEYSWVLLMSLLLTFGVAAALAVPSLLGLASILEWFGADFVGGLSIARWMVVAAVIESVTIAIYQSLPSRLFMWHSFGLVAVPRDVTFVVLAAMWIPSSQGIGFATAWFASQVVALVGTLVASVVVARRAPGR